MDSKDKKHYRQLKRDIKKAGTRRLRQRLKNNLAAHPDEAHLDEIEYDDSLSSHGMNGMDQDNTRRRRE